MGFPKYSFDDYEIGRDGKVYSKKRKRYVKPQLNGTGYYRVGIAGKLYFIHRLVASKYIPNPKNLPQVNHKDGNRLNNNVENLEWCTNRENSLHALHNGTMWIEERHPMAKLCRDDVAYIKSHPEKSRKELAGMFDISPRTITDIRSGKTWRTVEKIC